MSYNWPFLEGFCASMSNERKIQYMWINVIKNWNVKCSCPRDLILFAFVISALLQDQRSGQLREESCKKLLKECRLQESSHRALLYSITLINCRQGTSTFIIFQQLHFPPWKWDCNSILNPTHAFERSIRVDAYRVWP